MQNGFDNLGSAGVYPLERVFQLFLGLMLEHLFIDVEDLDARMFVLFFQRLHICPEDGSLLVFALHPVLVGFAASCQVLLQLGFVLDPVLIELVGCLLDVLLDCFCFDFSY